MKKFNVKNNIAVVVSEGFKKEIRSAVEFTSRERNLYGRTRYDKSFIGTIVTFNPNNQLVEYFSVNEYIDSIDNKSEVKKLVNQKIERISRSDEYSKNELIEVIYAIDFEYYGHSGYPSKEVRDHRDLVIENKFMSLYIEIVGRMNNDSIKDLDLSVRTLNCLQRAGYETVQQVKNLTFDEVARIRNLGMNSLRELEQVLDIKFV